MQTNEAARCATLLPQVSSINGPVALLEISYRYRQGDTVTVINPLDEPSSVILRCTVDGGTTVPSRLPDVAWRAGIDLRPIDIRNDEEES